LTQVTLVAISNSYHYMLSGAHIPLCKLREIMSKPMANWTTHQIINRQVCVNGVN